MLNETDGGQAGARLDAQRRRHLGLMVRQSLLLAVLCVPLALIGHDPLAQYVVMLRAAFGFSSVVMALAAMVSRARLSPTSLCIWDHAAALVLVNLGCKLALHALA